MNLRKAIFQAFEDQKTACSEELISQIELRLRDYFAHETMKFLVGLEENVQKGLLDFFQHIFKNVSSFKEGNK